MSLLHTPLLGLELILGIEVPRPAPKPRPVVLAESLHREYRSTLGEMPPFDVRALCQRLGLGTHAWPLAPEIAGVLLRRRGRHHVVVNSRHRLPRRRWTAAHELYHYFEHRDLLVPLTCMLDENPEDEETRIREAEANRFAAELLAPAAWVRSEWSRWGRVPVLAEEFGVSVGAMRNRVRELRLSLRPW